MSNSKNLKTKLKSPDRKGFISVVALGIFFLLSIFGMMVQSVVLDTLRNIKSTNNYYTARDIADSLTEYLQFTVKNFDAGFNETINCTFSGGALVEKPIPPNTASKCNQFASLVGSNEVKINLEISGRNEKKINESCLNGLFTSCYVIPELGKGEAGKNCNLYKPEYKGNELDDECNWNILKFGSTATERAVIPFYYDNGTNIISYIKNSTYTYNFALRMRLPCKVYNSGGVCTDRYQFNTDDGNDLVVQWQFTGQCDDGKTECGMVPLVKLDNEGHLSEYSTGIDENLIHIPRLNPKIVLIDSSQYKALDTDFSAGEVRVKIKLKSMDKPVLTIYLNDDLIADDNKNIPYIEYQIVTPELISNPKSRLSASIKVNGNTFEKTIYQSKQSGLIDYAIQN